MWRFTQCILALLVVLTFSTGCTTVTSSNTNHKSRFGCLLTIDESSRRVLTEPLIIVGEREGIDEDDNPVQEWWVWFPTRPKEDYTDQNGVLRAVNIPKAKVLFTNETKIIKGLVCKCPG